MSLAARYGAERVANDPDLTAALERYVGIIGEAAAKVSDETRAALGTLRWGPIVKTRNIIVHGYADVRFDLLWEIATVHVPELMATVSQYLDTPEP